MTVADYSYIFITIQKRLVLVVGFDLVEHLTYIAVAIVKMLILSDFIFIL